MHPSVGLFLGLWRGEGRTGAGRLAKVSLVGVSPPELGASFRSHGLHAFTTVTPTRTRAIQAHCSQVQDALSPDISVAAYVELEPRSCFEPVSCFPSIRFAEISPITFSKDGYSRIYKSVKSPISRSDKGALFGG